MAINYAKIFNRRATPQSQPIPGSSQVRNSGGGYSWQVDDWTRFDRFLILGAEGGTYYITERDLVNQNHDALLRCIKADGVRAVNRIFEISDAGRAPKNDPAIFALALVVTHGDLLRLAHPKAPSPQHDAVFRWMLNGADSLGEREVKRKVRGEDRIAKYGAVGSLPKLIEAFEQAKRASCKDEIVKLITEFDMPREAIPTQWLSEVAVWDALRPFPDSRRRRRHVLRRRTRTREAEPRRARPLHQGGRCLCREPHR